MNFFYLIINFGLLNEYFLPSSIHRSCTRIVDSKCCTITWASWAFCGIICFRTSSTWIVACLTNLISCNINIAYWRTWTNNFFSKFKFNIIYLNNFYHVPFINPVLALSILNVVTLLGQVKHFVESLAIVQVLHE